MFTNEATNRLLQKIRICLREAGLHQKTRLVLSLTANKQVVSQFIARNGGIVGDGFYPFLWTLR